MAPLPLGLTTALESGNCVLFVGAGIGLHFTSAHDGKPLPDAGGLADDLNRDFVLAAASSDLAKIAKLVELRKGRAELDAYLRKRLGNVEPDSVFSWITSVRWGAIFTTNYDNGIERAYEKAEKPFQTPLPVTLSKDYALYDPRFQVPVFHIHGALFGEQQSIVITQDDYARFRERRRMMFDKLKEKFATSTFLYIGYSNNDPNWALMLEELSEDFFPSTLPQSYRVAPGTSAIDVEILAAKNVDTIDAKFGEFADAAALALKDSIVEPDVIGRYKKGIPLELQAAFEKNPAAVIRLLNSWEYVNQAAFDASSNVAEFLKGNRPNWSLIAKQDFFKRDIEDKIFDALLDYATSSLTKPKSGLVLGNAGFGMTTLLKVLAVALVREKVKPVFFHRPGMPVFEGDIEFATSLFGAPSFFFIDDVSPLAKPLSAAIDRLANLDRPAYFLMGARRNEWQTGWFKQRKSQFILELLSDTEIERLLDFLGRHHALNKLEGLDRGLQIAEVKRRNSKDLLVTMRSATEGIDFDAIIESEYRGVPSDAVRQAYLAVCALYQHGAFLRDAILAKLMGVAYAELYAALGSDADGVIVFDLVDEAMGVHAARARHRVIAQVVWERCGDRTSKDNLLQMCIESLNVTYRADSVAFEQLVRSDRLIDELSTLERKIKFFETATQKEPDNQYVQQHYARMLFRADKLDLALGKIDQGIRLNELSCPRILYHTKAIILIEMMKDAESEQVARRRMIQAEETLRTSLRINPKDHYMVQALAKLYFEWAKRVESPDESGQYLQKAEEVVSAGLRDIRDREALWILSAEIQDWLGEDSKRLKFLRRAVDASTTSPVSRFLLARALREAGDPAEAKTVLQPIIESNPDEYRAYLEYALAVYALGDMDEAIRILELSTLYGHSDCRYLSTHGGLLFLAGKYARAQKVFEEYRRRDFDEDELRTPYFRPKDPTGGGQLHMIGTVAAMYPGYCFINSPPHPKFICPSSKFGGVALREGDKVDVTVSFSARGALGYYPTKLS
jgi:tetratricopeptide (TPR) repeat protein